MFTMKKGALAKKIGLRIMDNFYVPIKTKKGHFVQDSKYPQLNRVKHVTTYDELIHYYSFNVKPKYKKLIKSVAIKKNHSKGKNQPNKSKSKSNKKNHHNPEKPNLL